MSSFLLFHRHIIHVPDRRPQPLHPPPPRWSGGSSPQTSCLLALKPTAIRGAFIGDTVLGGFNSWAMIFEKATSEKDTDAPNLVIVKKDMTCPLLSSSLPTSSWVYMLRVGYFDTSFNRAARMEM